MKTVQSPTLAHLVPTDNGEEKSFIRLTPGPKPFARFHSLFKLQKNRTSSKTFKNKKWEFF
jgi:hypothetical protein